MNMEQFAAMRYGKGSGSILRKPATEPLCPQIPYNLTDHNLLLNLCLSERLKNFSAAKWHQRIENEIFALS
jgi:hypothetical protein